MLRSAMAAVALITAIGAPLPSPASTTHNVSFEFFETRLAPYGSWHVSERLGRVWIPRVRVIGWHPYAYGHWTGTAEGWSWVSDHEWGAIPYHYGTWALEPELGWVWVPGYTWAASWVVFRSGPSYVGWAPVPVGGSRSSDYGADHFVFVRKDDFRAPHIQRFAVPRERARMIFPNTQVTTAPG
jgi:hypothetical protein